MPADSTTPAGGFGHYWCSVAKHEWVVLVKLLVGSGMVGLLVLVT
jgi:hypothetical protein